MKYSRGFPSLKILDSNFVHWGSSSNYLRMGSKTVQGTWGPLTLSTSSTCFSCMWWASSSSSSKLFTALNIQIFVWFDHFKRSRCSRIAYLRTSGSQIRQKMLRFSRPSPGWHFSRCSEATCCEIRNQEWTMVASLYKLKARYHDPAFNSCPDKNDVHLEANSNEIAAAILTPHCTPGSKVNLCKTNYIFLHT